MSYCPHCGGELPEDLRATTAPGWLRQPIALPRCNHCYCIREQATAGNVAHVRCCKCGDRIAASGTYTVSNAANDGTATRWGQ